MDPLLRADSGYLFHGRQDGAWQGVVQHKRSVTIEVMAGDETVL